MVTVIAGKETAMNFAYNQRDGLPEFLGQNFVFGLRTLKLKKRLKVLKT